MAMSRHTRRRAIAVQAASVLFMGSAMVVISPAIAHAFTQGDFSGSLMRGRAFGASAAVTSSTASAAVGEVALQSLGCNPALDNSDTKDADQFTSKLNTVVGVIVPLPDTTILARSDTIRDTGTPTGDASGAEVRERSVVQGVSLLAGRIRATVIQSDAHTRFDASGWNNHTSSDEYADTPGNVDGSTGTTLTDLTIDLGGNGTRIQVPPNPAPNTVYTISGVGRLVVNEQFPAGSSFKDPLNSTRKVHSGIDVNALHLYIGDPPGTSFAGFTGEVIIGHTETRISSASGRLSGFVYGTRGSVTPLLESGPQAILRMPCSGTGGTPRTVSQTTTKFSLPGTAFPTLLSTGTLSGSVNGVLDATGGYSHSVEDIQRVKLLVDSTGAARVSVDVLHAIANTNTVPGGLVSSGAGTSVSNLVLDLDGPGGQAPIVLNGEVPPNTSFDLIGIGTLVLNEQSCKDGASDDTTKYSASCSSTAATGSDTHYESLSTRVLHLTITDPNNGGKLPVGAEVFVGVAHSDVAF
jgi:hypothetical protein